MLLVGVKSTRINENANGGCQVYERILMMDVKFTRINKNNNDGCQIY